MRDENGELHLFAVVFTDITELKQGRRGVAAELPGTPFISEERYELAVYEEQGGIWD